MAHTTVRRPRRKHARPVPLPPGGALHLALPFPSARAGEAKIRADLEAALERHAAELPESGRARCWLVEVLPGDFRMWPGSEEARGCRGWRLASLLFALEDALPPAITIGRMWFVRVNTREGPGRLEVVLDVSTS